jgi:hypothetical protein
VTGQHAGNKPALVGNGRYVLTERLDGGGVAGVYLAFDRHDETWRAVKFLSPEFMADAAARARFEREAVVMSRLSHPQLVRAIELHDDATSSLIVMELARGGTAAQWLEKFGPMPASLAAHVAVQVCEGLSAVHAAGIAHNDVTPANVLFDASGSVRVSNFHYADGDITGETGLAADTRADVAGVARLVYSLGTGHTPTVGQPIDVKHLPGSLARLVEDAIAGAYATIEPLADALDVAAANDDSVVDGTPSLAAAQIDVPTEPPPVDTDETAGGGARYAQPHHRGATPPGMPPRMAPPALLDTPPGAPRSELAPPPVLPYTMPDRPSRSQRLEIERRLALEAARLRGEEGVDPDDDDRPEWLASTPAPAVEREYTITPAVASGRLATPAPAMPRRPTPRDAPARSSPLMAGARVVNDAVLGEVIEDSGLDVPDAPHHALEEVDEEEEDSMVSALMFAAGFIALVLPMVLGVGIYLGSLSVTEAQVTSSQKQGRFYQTIEAQQDVIREIGKLGGDEERLSQAFFAYHDANDTTRRKAAEQYAEVLAIVWDQTPRGAMGARTAERVRVIRIARREHQHAMATWTSMSSNLLGAAAVAVGLAERPP